MEKIQVNDKLTKIVSSTGYFAKKDRTATYEGEIYLGIYDSETNYIEITETEKTEIDKAIEEKYEQERLAMEVEQNA